MKLHKKAKESEEKYKKCRKSKKELTKGEKCDKIYKSPVEDDEKNIEELKKRFKKSLDKRTVL